MCHVNSVTYYTKDKRLCYNFVLHPTHLHSYIQFSFDVGMRMYQILKEGCVCFQCILIQGEGIINFERKHEA